MSPVCCLTLCVVWVSVFVCACMYVCVCVCARAQCGQLRANIKTVNKLWNEKKKLHFKSILYSPLNISSYTCLISCQIQKKKTLFITNLYIRRWTLKKKKGKNRLRWISWLLARIGTPARITKSQAGLSHRISLSGVRLWFNMAVHAIRRWNLSSGKWTRLWVCVFT